MLPGGAAFVPVLEGNKCQRGVLALTREAKANHAHHAAYFRLLEHKAFDLLHDLHGAFSGSTRRKLHVHQHCALVFSWKKRGGQAVVKQRDGSNDGRINYQVARSLVKHASHQAFIAFCAFGEISVKPGKKAFTFQVVACFYGLEQGAAQRGCQRQGHEGGEANRRHHHRGKLAVNIAGGSREESQWHKHGDQYHGHANNGPGDLAHGFACGFLGWKALFAHDALNVFHHNNRVVDDDTNHEHHAKHGQHVDGKAQRQQRGKCAQQSDGDHNRGDDGVAPILQKQEHHQEHQSHRFQQRVCHLGNRDAHEVRAVVGDGVGHPFWEVL